MKEAAEGAKQNFFSNSGINIENGEILHHLQQCPYLVLSFDSQARKFQIERRKERLSLTICLCLTKCEPRNAFKCYAYKKTCSVDD